MSDPELIFRELIAGRLTPRAAAAALLANASTQSGLATGPSTMTPQEHALLATLMPAVRWEMLKLNAPGVPAVDFGSPEYHAYMATAVTVTVDPQPRIAD